VITAFFLLPAERSSYWYLTTNATHLIENYTAFHGQVLWYIHLKLSNIENKMCQRYTFENRAAVPCMSHSSDCNKDEMIHTGVQVQE
jgi:hypothetical protein